MLAMSTSGKQESVRDKHVTDEDHIPYFNKKDKDFEALQKIVLNVKWLESLQHYVHFRWVEAVILITTRVPYNMWKFLPISPPALVGETRI